MPPPIRTFWNQPWASYNTALQECDHCQLTFTLYDCGCVRMTLPHFDEDPLSTSCRIYPPSEYSFKPKPTTRPKIFYKRRNDGCGRVNESDCRWDAKKETPCPYELNSRGDCEDYVHIYKKCTHVRMRFVGRCQNEENRYNRGEPPIHVPHIVGGVVDDFCSRECLDKQAVLDEEQQTLEEEMARRIESEAQARNETERSHNYDMETNKTGPLKDLAVRELTIVLRHRRLL
ncbi:uncharacterized protein EAF01_005265 [Botrytis porri]|uniref:Uncharacterized protein n=1 Tax=Botrytis porri TaxID=87229 RepID=A0A4Z1KIS9_9HELO|nr:uncharacterized protein EAF01_005265 [Botrytis porri]KAF7907679.1 hypothetical protein EAF01_005265 [Botrytis porri]TGO81073.1 hypothetical protein BPOR_1374g00020 [Botrytis porri]